ncbi:MAG TPA: LuxR C-terminal-related transcriptional regulator, partial [Umezawaea sp.]|nr:LuxR C-terminal-related transcriptional regulator [Umezawaea sp.]
DREMALRLEARLRLTTQEDPVELVASVDRLRELGTDPALASSGERELYAVLLYAGMLTERVAPDVLIRLGNRVLAREPGPGVQVHSALPVVVSTLVAVESVQNLDPWLRAAEEDAQRQKMLFARALVRARRAMVLCCVGDLARARDLAVETLGAADPMWLEVIASCAVTLATVAVELRDTSLADGVMTRCLRSAEAFQMSTLLGLIRGSAAITADNLPAAVEHFEDLSRHFERIGWHNPTLFPVQARLVTLYARLGNAEMADELSERNLERTRRSGIAGPVGRALRLRGALTTGKHSVSLLRESVDALSTSINRLELAKAQVLLGQRLRETGDDSADAYLREGHGHAVSAGATWLVERANALLGGRQAWRRLDGRATLTTTERRVVELVVGGHRNKEVADQLGVGSRAVEKHLTSAYRKLGVVGRSDLAAAMSTEDDLTGGSPQGFWAG